MLKWCKEEEKCEDNQAFFRSVYLANYKADFFSNLVCKVVYMEDIKYVNLIEIGPVVIEI